MSVTNKKIGSAAFVLLFSMSGMLAIPHASQAQSKTALTTSQIDHMIRAEWNKESIVPANGVDDARFLRRIYLDIVGVIPSEQTVKTFLNDSAPNKRAQAVADLLDSPKYADNWTAYWDTVLMGRGRVDNQVIVDRSAFKQWLHKEFAQNAPWNKFVYDLISASGVNSEGGSYAKAMGVPAATSTMAANPAPTPQNGRIGKKGTGANAPARVFGKATPTGDGKMMPDGMMPDGAMTAGSGAVKTANLPAPLNGATNWILKYQGKPQDLSGTASKLFLGVQIQCAQCHDHKTEKWKQEDFRRFTACFVNARPRPVDPTLTRDQLKGSIRQIDLEEAPRPFVRRAVNGAKVNPNAEYAASNPMALDGTNFADTPNRRAALAAWMTSKNNPWFAKAIVNRLWNHFLGRGFIEPIDDIRPSNPVVMPELLDALANDFVAHEYDLKYLIKQICATQVYQLAATPAKKADTDNKLWAHYRLKPMNPEELMDSLVLATNMGPVLERIAGGRIDQIKYAMNRQFSFLFDVDEEFEQKDFEGTIPQALMLLNGNLVNRGATPIPGTTLAEVLRMSSTDKDKISELYLRTLSRMPTTAELTRWTEFVQSPRYMSTAPEAVMPTSAAQTVAPDKGRFANRNGQGTTGSANGVPAGPKANPQALQNALRNRKGNNGFDPLARLAPQATSASQTSETQAYEDLFWALLNSSEFMFNH